MGSAIIERARAAGRGLLTEVESKDALAAAGIPVIRAQLASDAKDAVAIANRIGYPVVLKVVSESVAHKSDVGGVVLNLGDAAAVEAAYVALIASVRAAGAEGEIGVSVQPQARPGTEIIVGVSRDPQFGPALMFGLGGVMVEVLGDVSFRIVPLAPRDAREMLHEIRGFRVLEGYRGHPPADLAALEALLLQVSRFVEENPAIQEIDLNPVFAYSDGAVAVDARIVVGEELSQEAR